MKRTAALALALACGPSFPATGIEFELVGHYNNVVSSDQGEHCGGYSLDLWKSKGRLFGLLHRHSGLCGDPPCSVIRNPTLSGKTGRLTFNSVIGPEQFSFTGVLRRDRVVGKINGRSLRLESDPPMAFEPDTSLQAWCSFWQGVPRCTGVRQLCAELQ